jgi:hypothetical protein
VVVRADVGSVRQYLVFTSIFYGGKVSTVKEKSRGLLILAAFLLFILVGILVFGVYTYYAQGDLKEGDYETSTTTVTITVNGSTTTVTETTTIVETTTTTKTTAANYEVVVSGTFETMLLDSNYDVVKAFRIPLVIYYETKPIKYWKGVVNLDVAIGSSSAAYSLEGKYYSYKVIFYIEILKEYRWGRPISLVTLYSDEIVKEGVNPATVRNVTASAIVDLEEVMGSWGSGKFIVRTGAKVIVTFEGVEKTLVSDFKSFTVSKG